MLTTIVLAQNGMYMRLHSCSWGYICVYVLFLGGGSDVVNVKICKHQNNIKLSTYHKLLKSFKPGIYHKLLNSFVLGTCHHKERNEYNNA